MVSLSNMDWHSASEAEQLACVKTATTAEMEEVLRSYSWQDHPVSVLGWISARQGLGLGAALSAFFNGDPMRFNYLPQRDIPKEFHGECRLLDSICRRINAGFYLPTPRSEVDRISRLNAWMHYQQEDVAEHRRGRWVLEEAILEPIFGSAGAQVPGAASTAAIPTGRDVFSPLARP